MIETLIGILLTGVILLTLNYLLIIGIFQAAKEGKILYPFVWAFESLGCKFMDYLMKGIDRADDINVNLDEWEQRQVDIYNEPYDTKSAKLCTIFNYIKKPLYSCAQCMASVWGIIFLAFASSVGLEWNIVSWHTVFYIPILSGLIHEINKTK